MSKNWDDHKLKWKENEYGNIFAIGVPTGKIWKPIILLCKLILKNIFIIF